MYDQFQYLVRYRETITGNLSLWKINKKSRKFNLFFEDINVTEYENDICLCTQWNYLKASRYIEKLNG